MKNIERLQLEVTFNFPLETLKIYLQENGLDPDAEYEPNNTSKKAIYSTVLMVLENVSQDINLMKNYKEDDISVSAFHENLLNKIQSMERKIRMMSASEDTTSNSSTFMLFNS